MKLTRQLALRRNRPVWADAARKLRTLESFAATEEDGGRDLAAAARRISDPELRQHIERHANDELRHANLFRRRASELAATVDATRGDEEADKPYDLSRRRPGLEVDAHGFFNAGLYDELGEVAYVAMLHVAEQRAAELFELHRELNHGDTETRALFDEILRDEKYHVAYTGKFLDGWKSEGREHEVSAALRSAKSSRFMGAWKRLGVRSAGSFSRAVLHVLYWTLLLPFGLVSKGRETTPGWSAGVAGPPESQY